MTITLEEQIKAKLTLKVLKYCHERGLVDSAEAEPYVTALLKKVPAHYRPTKSGVLTAAKRKLWNLAPAPWENAK